MTALEVSTSGHRVCLAGVGDDGVLTVTVSCHLIAAHDYTDIDLLTHGYDRQTDERCAWAMPCIGVGSEVLIRVVEADAVDAPDERYQVDSAIQAGRFHDTMRHAMTRMTPDDRRSLLRELVAELQALAG